MNKQLLEVLYDVSNLSSGTVAALTGYRNYSDLDEIQNEFVAFVEKTIERQKYKNWMEAWDYFVGVMGFTPAWAFKPAEIQLDGIDWVIEPHEDGNHYKTYMKGKKPGEVWYHVRDLYGIDKKLYKDVCKWLSGELDINGNRY